MGNVVVLYFLSSHIIVTVRYEGADARDRT
jgi:hypothetical protein